MSLPYLDGDTIALCHQAMPDGGTLEDIAGRLHFDTQLFGRLLQLPTVKPAASSNVESEFGHDTMAMESYVMADAMLKSRTDDRVT